MTSMRRRTLMTGAAVTGAALVIAAASCGSTRVSSPSGDTGQMRLALSATAGTTTYVLANATFTVTRVQPPPDPGDITSLVLHSSTDPTETDLTASVAVGRYTVTLGGPWQIDRVDPALGLVPVQGTLLSANPATVSVLSGQTTTVTFQFQTTGIPLNFGPGAIDVGVGVATCDPAPPPGAELNAIANADFEVSTAGWTQLDRSALVLSNDAHCGLHSGRAASTGGNPAAVYRLRSPGPPTRFAFSAWVKHDSSAPRTLMIKVDSGCPDGNPLASGSTVPPNVWTLASGTAILGGPTCGVETLSIFLDGFDATDVILVDDVYAIPGQTVPDSPDTTPPEITIGGVTDGEVTGAAAVTPTFLVTDDRLQFIRPQLDGAPFASGSPVTAEGGHRLQIYAVDTTDNQATAAVSFTIDRTPPALTVAAPADGAIVRSLAVTVTGSVTDATFARLDVGGMDVQVAADGSFAQALTLTEGANTIIVTAFDRAGHSSQVVLNVTAALPRSPPGGLGGL
jgi:hypothetical protein